MTPHDPPMYRALVVDDGPLNRKLVRGLLVQLGCEVDTAASAKEALVKCASGTYDVAFVDLHMPEMDGRELVRALREAERSGEASRLPVVVLTADDAAPAGDQGWFDMFVSKPITSALLKASLEVLSVTTSQQPTMVGPAPVDLIDEFLHATSDALERMKQALADGDFESIVSDAHGVNGTGTSFGFSVMSALGAALEHHAKVRSREGVERGLFELERSLSCT